MAVTNEDDFREWLEQQPQEVCVAIAYRAVMRVLPLAGLTSGDGEPSSRLALAAFRASLTSGVAVVGSAPHVRAAARAADAAARAADAAARAAGSAAYAAADAADAAVARAVYAAADAADARRAAYTAAARAAYTAAARAADAARAAGAVYAAYAVAYADTDLTSDELMRSAIAVPSEVLDAIEAHATGKTDLLRAGGPWTFWANWYDRAMAGDPLPWDLQEQIALIPNDIWEAGPEAVATEIEKIEAAYWSGTLPQAEVLILGDDGRFDVQPAFRAMDVRLDNILDQVQFARDLALATNCGFNPMCVAYKYLAHVLEQCRDDPNTIEQHFRQARDILKRKLGDGDYSPDDALQALIDSLDQHALQMRANFDDVREAYDLRVKQKLRETDDKMLRMVAGGMREFQDRKTTGRLSAETGLDAETVERAEGVDAMATAIQRTGGRAAAAQILERASQAAKTVDASGGYKAVQIATTGWTLIAVLKEMFKG